MEVIVVHDRLIFFVEPCAIATNARKATKGRDQGGLKASQVSRVFGVVIQREDDLGFSQHFVDPFVQNEPVYSAASRLVASR